MSVLSGEILVPAFRPAAVRPRVAVARPRAAAVRHGEPVVLRLTGRGRVVVAVIAMAVALLGSLVSQRAMAGQPPEAVPVTTRTVAPGETLWDIARSYTAPGQDVRDVVDAVTDLNGLTGGLRAGQELLIPVP